MAALFSEGPILSHRDSGLRWLTFNQPDKHNAVSLEMATLAGQVVQDFASNTEDRVLIVCGAGGKAFNAGADISEFDKQRADAKANEAYSKVFGGLFHGLRDVEKPTIAMINGICFGGGVALAMACDMRICSEDALFAIPAARLGVGYNIEFVDLLMQLVGPARAKEILYTARRYTAKQALQMGLASDVVANDRLEETTRDCAETIAQNAPLTLRATKITVTELAKPSDQRNMPKVDTAISACFDSADFRNARKSFMEKRKPVFEGK